MSQCQLASPLRATRVPPRFVFFMRPSAAAPSLILCWSPTRRCRSARAEGGGRKFAAWRRMIASISDATAAHCAAVREANEKRRTRAQSSGALRTTKLQHEEKKEA